MPRLSLIDQEAHWICLTLTLFVFGIGTDHHHSTVAANDTTFFADPTNGRTHLHNEKNLKKSANTNSKASGTTCQTKSKFRANRPSWILCNPGKACTIKQLLAASSTQRLPLWQPSSTGFSVTSAHLTLDLSANSRIPPIPANLIHNLIHNLTHNLIHNLLPNG